MSCINYIQWTDGLTIYAFSFSARESNTNFCCFLFQIEPKFNQFVLGLWPLGRQIFVLFTEPRGERIGRPWRRRYTKSARLFTPGKSQKSLVPLGTPWSQLYSRSGLKYVYNFAKNFSSTEPLKRGPILLKVLQSVKMFYYFSSNVCI